MSNENNQDAVEKLRINRAFWLAVIGLFLAVVVMISAGWLLKWTATDVVAVVGLFTSVLGTLVGAFFGVQVGSAGRERAEQRAENAENKATDLMGIVFTSGNSALIDEAKSIQ